MEPFLDSNNCYNNNTTATKQRIMIDKIPERMSAAVFTPFSPMQLGKYCVLDD
jgi:hypothetical protein